MKTRLITIVVAAALATGVLLVVNVPSSAQVGPFASGSFPLPMAIPASAMNGAGTVTSAQVLAPNGSTSVPSYSFANEPTFGFYRAATSEMALANPNATGGIPLNLSTSQLKLGNVYTLAWTSVNSAFSTVDTGLSRTATGVVAVGNGTQGDTSGRVLAASFAVGSSSVILSGTAPTISSGFGTGAAFQATNGTAAFALQVGTGGVATSGVIGLPTVAGGWTCHVFNATARTGHRADNTVQTANTTSSVTIENQTTSTGAAVAWTASDQVRGSCFPF